MRFCCSQILLFLALALMTSPVRSQTQPAAIASLSSSKPTKKSVSAQIDAGLISNGVYRNKTLGFSCPIPAGWVLRTDEMNQREDASASEGAARASASGGQVLLAAFSRPPEARAEDVNSSILIAAESAASYPGLKDAAQYFGPLTEVARAQGLTVTNEPYEIALGSKTLVRSDFQKDVGSRVLRQATLAMLTNGYAISFTLIGGTEAEVDELVESLTFAAPSSSHK
jgi:hypothetical protein